MIKGFYYSLLRQSITHIIDDMLKSNLTSVLLEKDDETDIGKPRNFIYCSFV